MRARTVIVAPLHAGPCLCTARVWQPTAAAARVWQPTAAAVRVWQPAAAAARVWQPAGIAASHLAPIYFRSGITLRGTLLQTVATSEYSMM